MSLARDIADLGSVTSRLDTVGASEGALSNRRLTINGAMEVSQRGTVTGITGSAYGPDRCGLICSNSGTYTLSQAADAPSGSGFDKSLDVACTSSDTYGTAADVTHLRLSSLEGQDCMQFEHGTSSAKKLTVQFWVKCSYADTFGLAFVNHASQKSNVQKFTISSANTWQYVTLTYDGDTAAGFTSNNILGLSLDLFLGGGSNYTGGSATLNNWDTRSNNQSTYVSSTSTKFGTATSHTFNLTGLQLEVGDTATDFEHRSFGDELQSCQRFFAKSYVYSTAVGGATTLGMVQTDFHENNQGAGYRENYSFKFPVQMRASPTITSYDSAGTSGKGNYYMGTSSLPARTISIGSINATSFGGYSDRATTIGGWAMQYTADAEL